MNDMFMSPPNSYVEPPSSVAVFEMGSLMRSDGWGPDPGFVSLKRQPRACFLSASCLHTKKKSWEHTARGGHLQGWERTTTENQIG